MSDPVAEAAAQLAEQNQTLSIPAEAGTTAPGEPVIAAVEKDTTPAEPDSPVSTSAAAPSASESSSNSSASPDDLPNAAPAAVESTTGPASAPSAAGADITSNIAASSVEPLHVRVAAHLEAIFQMVKTDTEAAPSEAAAHAQTVKTHIGDVLHRISNGMAVAEGELVQKLEALYRML